MRLIICLILVSTIFSTFTLAQNSSHIQYLLLNYSSAGGPGLGATSSSTIMNYIKDKFGAASQKSSLKVGVSCLYYPTGSGGIQQQLSSMKNDLAMAESLKVPILVQVDVEDWLPVALLNWYDPNLPGYDAAKKADVEWYGWDDSTAIKLCWRNWGSPFRVGPAPNYLSLNYQAYEKNIYDQFLPIVVQWYNNLPADEKWLFAGFKCGWESSLNNNYRFFPNGNSYYGTTNNPPWSNNYQPIGYNAAKTAGIQDTGTITTSTIAKIVGEHLTYLSKMAYDAGIPRNKIFVHGTFYSTYQQDMDAVVNHYANPGVSFYGSASSPLDSNIAFMQAVRTAEVDSGATGYAYGEFNLFTTNYDTWDLWFKNALIGDSNCVYQALYNYDSMYGQPSVENALLNAMAQAPTAVKPQLVQPANYSLEQNYPNPFNPSTEIMYSVPNNGFVSLKVYNVLGQRVATLFSGVRPAGNYTAIFQGERFASGVYFYRLDAGNVSITKKMILMK